MECLLVIHKGYMTCHLLTSLLADVSEELQKLCEVGHPVVEAPLTPPRLIILI